MKSEHSSENIRILLISPLPPPPGGIASWTKILLDEIKKYPAIRIRHVDVAVRWKTIVNRSQILTLLGGSIQALRDIFRIFIATIAFRPHVLHLTSTAGYASLKDLVIVLMARVFAKGSLIHYHMSRLPRSQNAHDWRYRVAILAMRVATAVVVLDEKSYAFLKAILPPGKVKKVPNMIALEEIDKLVAQKTFSGGERSDARSMHLTFIGHVVPEKGLVEQIEACARLKEIQLHIVGPVANRFRKHLEQRAQSRADEHWLHFYGAVDHEEACRQIMLSDILLLPSYDEAFPNAVLEAMAFAKPLVVSNVGAMSEMIDANTENACGVCIKPRDPESLRAALERLLATPENLQAMGQRGRKRVEQLYTTRSVIKQLIELWTELAGYDLCDEVLDRGRASRQTLSSNRQSM